MLNLKCGLGHLFEGWFASEEDFIVQLSRSLVQCPVCGDSCIAKQLSAPRLNLSGKHADEDVTLLRVERSMPQAISHETLWNALAQVVAATTRDVGENFPEEARKIHYGEAKAEHGIHGTATLTEVHALVEEGIDVVALPVSLNRKAPLQ